MRFTSFICLVLASGLFVSSCGGSSAVNQPPVDQSATLTGKVLEDGGFRSVSEVTGIGGAELTLVSIDDGDLVGQVSADGGGNFAFAGIDPGEFLLTTTFDGDVNVIGASQDDGNAFTTLVSLEPGSVTEVIQEFNIHDLDLDDMDDSVEFTTITTVDMGAPDIDSRLVVPGEDMVYFDSDDDGSFDDEEGYVDEDGDGLPDELVGHMNSLHGGMLKGPIDEITDELLSVEGIPFSITDATQWKDKGNKEPERDVFGVGVNVLIRGFFNGEEWVALVVKTTGVRSGEGGGDDGGASGGDDSGGGDTGGDGSGD